MKELFREFETIKPEDTAKIRLQQTLEEKEMKKNTVSKFWKPIVAGVFVLGMLCLPAVQELMGNSIQVKAKEVEKINSEIEKANNEYKDGDLSYIEYKVLVDGLVQTRKEVLNDIQSQNPDYKISLSQTLDEEGNPSVNVVIENK